MSSVMSCGALRPTTNSTYDGPGGRVRISEEGTREKAPLLENSVPTSEKVSMDVPEGRPSISGSRELSTALEHARRAVQLDTDGLIPQAVEEYNKTAELLDELLGMAGEVGEAERVKMIRDTYKERAELLWLIIKPEDPPMTTHDSQPT
ncbi:hypothetical protein CTheo_2144 [Ceratobasidium theobromae]|uniref:MIT domain-containing protein n=1 Tax=Ceratobasidium theobromae TaxID=1582974 RepID=A0A5N5QT13_9AGAM|nr:hypothetical protein CTheo_2144 [Ceratobasidium theobromae]